MHLPRVTVPNMAASWPLEMRRSGDNVDKRGEHSDVYSLNDVDRLSPGLMEVSAWVRSRDHITETEDSHPRSTAV